MMEKLYQTFGIFGALVVSMLFFMLLIFWVAGLAGMTDAREGPRNPLLLVVAALVPPVPVVWLVMDMVRQYKAMKAP